MKVRLKFDHPHDGLEWDAYEIIPGLVRCVSKLVYPKSEGRDEIYVRKFEVVVPIEEIEVIQ